jgi:putative glutamine amidotransferase
MALPVIGVTTSYGKNKSGYPIIFLLRAYTNALIEAGGVPVLIPSDLVQEGWHALYTRLDGILFTGGGDISLEHFKGEDNPKIDGVEPERDVLELGLLKAAVDDGKPFLGICRGIQLMNVGLGGTLLTDIADQKPGALKHDYSPKYPRDLLAHTVEVLSGTRMAEILGETRLQVNSLHHQGLKDVAPGAKAVAFSPDDLVEGLEIPGHPFGLAVQWHPEWLTAQEAARRLFRAFIQAAGKS